MSNVNVSTSLVKRTHLRHRSEISHGDNNYSGILLNDSNLQDSMVIKTGHKSKREALRSQKKIIREVFSPPVKKKTRRHK